MLSSNKIAANRANAQLSTGPRTEAGKQRVSQNAVKHGLTAAHPLVHPHENDDFQKLRRDLHTQLLQAAWNLRRLRQLEDDLFAECDDPFTEPSAERKMNSYARHSARFERVYRNALRDLRQLQTDRALTVQAAKSVPVDLTALTDIRKLLEQSHRQLPKSAKPIPFADKPTLQDPEDALCSDRPLHEIFAGARP